jgi:ribose-phosphate pyrophosphokinase
MMGVYDPVVISPDVGGKARAEQFANILNCDSDFLKKTRNRETGEVIIDEEDLRIELRGRDCVLVDDIISSGTSIVKASNLVHKKGAANVVVFCTHALLIDGAADRIKAAGVRDIIATNSIPGVFSKVDLSTTIADSIRAHFTRLA